LIMPLERLAAAIEANATATRESLAAFKSSLTEQGARLLEIEQHMARWRHGGGDLPGAVSSLAIDVAKDEGFQASIARRAEKAIVPVKASALLGMERRNTIVSAITGGAVSPAARRPDIAFGPTKTRWLWELFGQPMPVTGAGSVEYVRETTAPTNAAAQSAEGAAKNQSTAGFELINETIPTIAHFLKASRQALSDSAALQRYLDVRLPWGLNLRLESDIINGTGAAGLGDANQRTAGWRSEGQLGAAFTT
jgi:HK97 family phage major capsid protein